MKSKNDNEPKCEVCRERLELCSVGIVSTFCYSCGEPILIADIDEDVNGNLIKAEVEFAKSKGVCIEKINFWGGEKELNLCKSCKSCIGPLYIPDYFSGDYPVEKYELGFYCSRCDRYFDKNK